MWHYDEKDFTFFFFLLQFLKEAGFCQVQAEDRTAQFIQVIETELERAEAIKEEFIEVQRRVAATDGWMADGVARSGLCRV